MRWKKILSKNKLLKMTQLSTLIFLLYTFLRSRSLYLPIYRTHIAPVQILMSTLITHY